MKLRGKLVLFIVSAVLIIFSAIIGYINHNSREILEQNLAQYVDTEAQHYAVEIEKQLEVALAKAQNLAHTLEGMKQQGATEREVVNTVLKNTLIENKTLFGVWSAWEPNAFDGKDEEFIYKEGHDHTGRYIPYWNRVNDTIALEPCVDYENLGDEGAWYRLPFQSGEAIIMEPFTYEVQGQQIMVVSIGVPIKVDDKILGVVGVDISLDYLQQSISDIRIFDTGFASIFSNEGQFVATANEQLIGQHISLAGLANSEEIVTNIKKGKIYRGFDYLERTNQEVYGVFIPIVVGDTTTPWALSISAPLDEALVEVDELLMTSVVAAIIGFIILVAIIWLIATNITKSLKLTTENLVEIGNGDFTREIPEKFKKSKDEIGDIARAVSSMQQSVKDTIGQINASSEELASSSEALTAIAQQSATASEEMARTIEEIAINANEQAKDADKGLNNLENLKQQIQKVIVTANEVKKIAEETNGLKNNGLKAIEDLTEKTKESQNATGNISKVILETDKGAEKINEASDVIATIAEQTNLLALNAAIEAARAGESGRGFAVVAEEIRKLAEQSSRSVGEIQEVINGLKAQTSTAVETMEKTKKTVEDQSAAVDLTEGIFSRLSEAVEKTQSTVAGLNILAQDMEGGKEEMTIIIESLAAIAEENAASTEEASASTEEQSASMIEIAKNSEQLTYLAQKLEKSVDVFRI
ncbi:MAG: methyl-accepting chemotaxis protein [Clostridiaceae bacterium]|nr:methyl-accepting chemotaxis protein [Clostridiaceae bacterium]